MLNLSQAKRILVVGGGTAGWLAALEMRHAFPPAVEVLLIESERIGILGAGEGSIPNFNLAMQRYGIDRDSFMRATQATYKLAVCFDGWRGQKDDRYYHFFSTLRGGVGLADWQEDGFFPYSSYLQGRGIPQDKYPDARRLVDSGASQQAVREHLAQSDQEPFAYHFDARRLAEFLRAQAELRGVRRIDATVQSVQQDERGDIASVTTDQGEFEADFFIDASGFARLIVGKTQEVPWESFSRSLLLDAALPFFMPLTDAAPPLVTMSKALRHGWMWVIPTQGRLGCGYVYSSAHATEEEVLRELEEHWQAEVAPVNRLRFSPGKLKKCLAGNAMAVGLSSGFVEPLEATSIAQTIYQLAFFGSLVQQNAGVIPQRVQDQFNTEVSNGWDGIRDFLVMHYDQARSDTPFWTDVKTAARPDSYLDLKECFRMRSPRNTDLVPYQMAGTQIFGVPSWECVGAAMGVVHADVAARQLARVGPAGRAKLQAFAETLDGL